MLYNELISFIQTHKDEDLPFNNYIYSYLELPMLNIWLYIKIKLPYLKIHITIEITIIDQNNIFGPNISINFPTNIVSIPSAKTAHTIIFAV